MALVMCCTSAPALAGFWSDKAQAVGLAAIVLNRGAAMRFEEHARENGFWNDAPRCGRLFRDYLDGLTDRFSAEPNPKLPVPLAATASALGRPSVLPEARYFDDLGLACSRRGLTEYGSWCTDLLNALGMSRKTRYSIRVGGLNAFMAEALSKAQQSCPGTATGAIPWLREQAAP